MATIKPFRGIRYAPEAVGALSEVICPPYDMIGSNLKAELRQRSPYNAVHLEGGEQPDPTDPQAGYRNAARLYRQWRAAGILQQDDAPSFYLMRHSYRLNGRSHEHLGLFAAVLVEDYETGAVLPHEFTREPAVRDRVALLQAGQTQFSPIMSLYQDEPGTLRRLFDPILAGPPVAAADTPAAGRAQLWRIADPNAGANVADPDAGARIADPDAGTRIARAFAGRPLFLADGHHRYEAARRYRSLQPADRRQDSAQAANYVMMTLVEFDDPGLLLLPYHRTLAGLAPPQLDAIRRQIETLYQAHPLPPDTTPTAALTQVADTNAAATQTTRAANTAGTNAAATQTTSAADTDPATQTTCTSTGPGPHCFAAFWADDTPPTFYTLRPGIDWASWDDLAVSEAWVLQERILAPILGAALPDHIDYSPDHETIVRQARSGAIQAAILLKPFPLAPFRQIVSAGRRLPPKSTFFYPKLPTGLVINPLDGALATP